MSDAAVRERLNELLEVIRALPCPKNRKSADEGVYEGQFARSSETLEAIVDGLRVQLKYLVFDLEATRRENRYLRKMLENRPPRGVENNEDDFSSF